jgi:hypothetical protein
VKGLEVTVVKDCVAQVTAPNLRPRASALLTGPLRCASNKPYQPHRQFKVSKATGQIDQAEADCGHRVLPEERLGEIDVFSRPPIIF